MGGFFEGLFSFGVGGVYFFPGGQDEYVSIVAVGVGDGGKLGGFGVVD